MNHASVKPSKHFLQDIHCFLVIHFIYLFILEIFKGKNNLKMSLLKNLIIKFIE